MAKYFCFKATLSFVLLGIGALVSWNTLQPTITAWPLDYDGFYYLTEIRSYIQTGRGYYSAFLPFFEVLGGIGRFFSLTPEQTFQSGYVLSLAFFATGTFVLAWNRKEPYLAATLVFLIAASQSLFLMHYGYLKQGAGMSLYVCMLACIRISNEVKSPRVRFWVSALAVFLGLLGGSFHKFSAVLSAVTLAVWKGTALPKWIHRIAVLIAATTLVFLLRDAFPHEDRLFKFWWPPVWFYYLDRRQISPYELLEFYTYHLAGLFVLFTFVFYRIRALAPYAFLSLYFLLIAPVWDWPIWRIGRSSFWIAFIWLALFFRWDFKDKLSQSAKNLVALFMVLAIGLGYSVLPRSPHLLGPAMKLDSLVQAQEILKAWIPPDAFVQAEHGMQFRITYLLERTSGRLLITGPWLPEKVFVLECTSRDSDCFDLSEVSPDKLSEVSCIRLDTHWQISRGQVLTGKPPQICP